MIDTKDSSISIWQTLNKNSFPELNTDKEVDVCIIGGGIVGLSTAYFLAHKNLSVVLIDDGEIGGRQTLRTTAHVSTENDDHYHKIKELHGAETAEWVADSHKMALRKIQEIIEKEKIDCDLEVLPGYLCLDPEHDEEYLEKELSACIDAGLRDVELVNRIPGTDIGPALQFKNQLQFHPGKYVLGLAKRAQELGVEIYSNTRAVDIDSYFAAGEEHHDVTTKNNHTIEAKYVVVATNSPVLVPPTTQIKLVPHRTHAIACKIPKDSFPSMLLWDTADNYHYVRKFHTPEQDYLIIGGEDHRTGLSPYQSSAKAISPFVRLKHWALERFPYAGEVAFHWSGQVMETVDYLPYIGSVGGSKKNILLACGDSGDGMVFGTVAGMLLTDLISPQLGYKNPWEPVYDPHRLPLKATARWIKENINTASQYKDWMTPGEVSSVEEIESGHGAVLRSTVAKVAAFRNENGELVEKSAVCTHMGGIVHWNEREKTWDCPCHGSRFSALGEVINGPATEDLKDIEIEVANEDVLRADMPFSPDPEISIR